MRALIYGLLFLPTAAVAADDVDFVQNLQGRYADYSWDTKRLVSLDLNRDGRLDHAALGLRSDKVLFLVEMRGSEAPIIVEIPVDASKQFGICPGGVPWISIRKQSEAPTEALGATPPGYQICPECLEIVVGGDECDPLQFYWDASADKLHWWRA